ncbi:hypothetical protein APX70_06290 [Pseudomonas syringae pv. maculicola]|uniref:Uncharacterized protein n=1 Tax=Pseudomonas syringae pv. maculicola TaxID=59511 RepID=A0A3M3A0R2_PSEYM|nr:hypothetical protein APX70_06290 [Pseudomonas syringae pv. maculicola]
MANEAYPTASLQPWPRRGFGYFVVEVHHELSVRRTAGLSGWRQMLEDQLERNLLVIGSQ